ncbi:MAG: hypothetical protein AB1295_04805 [Candidatus Micrarchaeota archaeon]
MQVLYIYDLKAKNKKSFNRTKRLFYYHMNNLPLKKSCWKSKSALAIPLKQEKMMDAFFKRFGKKVVVFKALIEEISELE